MPELHRVLTSLRRLRISLGVLIPPKVFAAGVFIAARIENGQPRVEVEKQLVAEADLASFLTRHVRDTKKLMVLIDAAPEVEWDTVAAIIDAARAAGITRTNFLQKR